MLPALLPVAENIWELNYRLTRLSAELGRRVTIIRLRSGKLLIHSSGFFIRDVLWAIDDLGDPGWIVDATLTHDSFAEIGRVAFPEIPYGAPDGFVDVGGPRFSLASPPLEWRDELEVISIDGMPRIREYAFFHRPSRTLIVADLVFNFDETCHCTPWTRRFIRWFSGIKTHPGMSRVFAAMIQDRGAFAQSIQRLIQCDFDRLVVGHGAIIPTGAKARFEAAIGRRQLGSKSF